MSKQTVVGTKKQGKLKTFGYIHASTSMQVEGGYSLDVQLNRIKRHAKDNNMTLVEIFRDEDKSGKNINVRPGFKRMLNKIRDGQKVDHVLVTRLSRFGCNPSDVLQALRVLKSHRVAL
jgi:resolvase domain protein